MEEFWNIAISIAGIGAVGAFVLYSLYKSWLSLPIFQTLTKKQLYNLFVIFLSLTFIFSICCLITYFLLSFYAKTPKPQKQEIHIKDSIRISDSVVNGDVILARQQSNSFESIAKEALLKNAKNYYKLKKLEDQEKIIKILQQALQRALAVSKRSNQMESFKFAIASIRKSGDMTLLEKVLANHAKSQIFKAKRNKDSALEAYKELVVIARLRGDI